MKDFPTIPTLTELRNAMNNVGNDVLDSITYCKSLEVPYPSRPMKPTLPPNHSVGQVAEYAKKLEEYSVKNEEYKELQAKVNAHNQKVKNLVEEYIWEESGLNTIPSQYRSKVAYYAYDQSHSCGYYEVYQTLCSLVNIFNYI
jgi:hypothetical protein